MLAFLAPCFVASLILTGIHAYLGVHVVERGVIFVDLSLAQIAALGATIALLLPISGGDPHAPVVYWISLAFTFIGALVFSTIRSQRARIPQEAIIGICYAVASAAAILAMSKATSESEHLKDMLVGNILAVSWPEVGKTAVLYGAVGVFHYIFRQQFLAISMDHADTARGARALGPVLGLPVLRLVRLRRHLVGGDCRRAAGVLLSDRAVGRRDALRRLDRQAAGDRLDDGDGRVGARRLSVAAARPADRRDDRLHVRPGSDYHGARAPPRSSASTPCSVVTAACEIADKALICYRCGTATTEAKYQPAPLPRRVVIADLIAAS